MIREYIGLYLVLVLLGLLIVVPLAAFIFAVTILFKAIGIG